MFFYFYDSFVSDKKHEDELNKAENRLIELGINGRIEKLSVLKNAKELIEDGIKKGAHTVVAVGDDATLIRVINIVADKDVKVGFIPMKSGCKFAKIIGINDPLEACNIISKRLVKKINLGKANQNYFISSLCIPEVEDIKIECDGKYKISLRELSNKLCIYNLGDFLETKTQNGWKVFTSKASYLNVVVSPENAKGLGGLLKKSNDGKESVFPAKKIKIESSGKSLPVVLDNQTTIKTPITVSIKPKKVELIVGKERMI